MGKFRLDIDLDNLDDLNDELYNREQRRLHKQKQSKKFKSGEDDGQLPES